LISPEIIERIKDALPLVEYIGRDVALKKAGADSYKGLCPFHNERTPSFTVNARTNRYRCFGCGKSGDIFEYVQERNHLGFGEAVRFLAEGAGIAIPAQGAREDAELTRQRRLAELNEKALEFFRHALRDLPAGRKALSYLANRNLSEATVETFKLGYAPPQWEALSSRLLAEHFEISTLVELGLARMDKDGRRAYDYFRDRVIFPIYDGRGRLVAFGGRVLGNDEPKYLNSPENSIFKKRSILYGYNLARKSIGDCDLAIIVEGYMDVIGLYQAGITNAVAPLGTALTQNHLEGLAKVCKRLTFLFDGDKAGRRAAFGAALPALQLGFAVRVVLMEEGEDAFDLALSRPQEEIEAYLRRGIPLVDFVLNTLYQNTESFGEGRVLAFLERACTFLADIKEEVQISLFLQKAAILAGVNVEELELDFKKKRSQGALRRPFGPPAPEQMTEKKMLPVSSPLTRFQVDKAAKENFEIYLMRLAGLHPESWPFLEEQLAQGLTIEDTLARLMLDALKGLAAKNNDWSGEAFAAAMPTEALRELVQEDITSQRLQTDWEKQITDTVDTLWVEIVRRERKSLDEEMRRQKLAGDEEVIRDLQEQILAHRRREDLLKNKARRQK
jgi:DNA primase